MVEEYLEDRVINFTGSITLDDCGGISDAGFNWLGADGNLYDQRLNNGRSIFLTAIGLSLAVESKAHNNSLFVTTARASGFNIDPIENSWTQDAVSVSGDSNAPPNSITINIIGEAHFEVWSIEYRSQYPKAAVDTDTVFYYRPKNIFTSPGITGVSSASCNVRSNVSGALSGVLYGRTSYIGKTLLDVYTPTYGNSTLEVGIAATFTFDLSTELKTGSFARANFNYTQGNIKWSNAFTNVLENNSGGFTFNKFRSGEALPSEPMARVGYPESAIILTGEATDYSYFTHPSGVKKVKSRNNEFILDGSAHKIDLTNISGQVAYTGSNVLNGELVIVHTGDMITSDLGSGLLSLEFNENSLLPNFYDTPYVLYHGSTKPVIKLSRLNTLEVDKYKNPTWTNTNCSTSTELDALKITTTGSIGNIFRTLYNDLVNLFTDAPAWIALNPSYAGIRKAFLGRKINSSADYFNYSNYRYMSLRAKASSNTTITLEILYSDLYRIGDNGLSFSDKTAVYTIDVTSQFTNIDIDIPLGLIKNTEDIVGHNGLKCIKSIRYIIPENSTVWLDKLTLITKNPITVSTRHVTAQYESYDPWPSYKDSANMSFTDTWKSVCFLNSFDVINTLDVDLDYPNSKWGFPNVYGANGFTIEQFSDVINLQEGMVSEVIEGDFPSCWITRTEYAELPIILYGSRMAHIVKVPPLYFKEFNFNLDTGVEVNTLITGPNGQRVELINLFQDTLEDFVHSNLPNSAFNHSRNTVVTGLQPNRYIKVGNNRYPRDRQDNITFNVKNNFYIPTGIKRFLSIIGGLGVIGSGNGGIINTDIMGMTRVMGISKDENTICIIFENKPIGITDVKKVINSLDV